MEKKSLLATLEEMGIPERAGEVYLSLLESGRMNIAQIAQASGVKRATCYEYLNLLLRKEVVVRVPIGKRLHYAACDPQKILNDFKKKSALFAETLQSLGGLYDKTTHKPRVTFYEGKSGVKHVYEDFFRTIGDTYSIFPPEAFFESFTENEYDNFDKTVGEHAFTSRDLFVVDKYYKKIQSIRKKKPAAHKSDKKLPEWFRTNVDVLIYSDKVALISLRDLSAIVIENRDIALLFKNMHTFMWKAL